MSLVMTRNNTNVIRNFGQCTLSIPIIARRIVWMTFDVLKHPRGHQGCLHQTAVAPLITIAGCSLTQYNLWQSNRQTLRSMASSI